jgi:hypothetical protein
VGGRALPRSAAGWRCPPSAAAERASTLADIYAQLLQIVQVAVAPRDQADEDEPLPGPWRILFRVSDTDFVEFLFQRLSGKYLEYRFGSESYRYSEAGKVEIGAFWPLWRPHVRASGTFRTVSPHTRANKRMRLAPRGGNMGCPTAEAVGVGHA